MLTGGGTGGHLTPLIAIAEELRRAEKEGTLAVPADRNSALEILYVGVATAVDRAFLSGSDIPVVHVPSGKIRRYGSGIGRTIIDLLVWLPYGVLRALWKMYVLMPEAVMSKGGYGSIPVVFAAWLYRIPILLHETDVVPGLANTRLTRFSSAIAVAYRATESHFPAAKVFLAGVPVRRAFRSPLRKEDARAALHLHNRKPVLFVTGGSQGSQRINVVVLELLTRLLPDFQILHQVGTANFAPIEKLVRETFRNFPDIGDYQVLGFLDEMTMAQAYTAADLVISRAGGTALAELAVVGRASILIPLKESANNHQWENAYFFREAGAAIVLDETNLSPPLLESPLRRLFQRPADLEMMASRVRVLSRPTAAEDLANLLVAMGTGLVPRRDLRSFTASSRAA